MFEWLRDEILRVRTRKFHVISGPLELDARAAVVGSTTGLPESYRSFVLEFGNVHLYRVNSRYLVRVFAVPLEFEAAGGRTLLQFGQTEGEVVYFDCDELEGDATLVHDWKPGRGLRRTAVGFEEWLVSACGKARQRISSEQWSKIIAGPAPFSAEEAAIIAARRRVSVRTIGYTVDNEIILEICNLSDRRISQIGVEIQTQHGVHIGFVRVMTSDLSPGETVLRVVDCYKTLYSPRDVIVVNNIDIGPEDRGVRWELRQ